MVKSCVAPITVKGSGLTFYRFPANIERRKKWIAAVRRDKWQLHFIPMSAWVSVCKYPQLKPPNKKVITSSFHPDIKRDI